MLSMREQAEMVPPGSHWNRDDGGTDVVVVHQGWRAGELIVSYVTNWPTMASQGVGTALFETFIASRTRVAELRAT